MAFKRIVANSEEDLKTIMNDIMNWFKETKDYKVNFSKEKRKFLDSDKNIVEKEIDTIKVVDRANDKETSIKFIPMKEKGEMKVEIGGESEAAVAGKISKQMKGKGKLKSYSKDKKVALKENPKIPTSQELEDEWEKRKANIMKSLKGQVSGKLEEEAPKPKLIDKIKRVFEKYKNQEIEFDYEPGSNYSNFIDDLENTRLFKGEDSLSDFTQSDIFDKLAQSYNILFTEPGYDPRKIELAPEKPSSPSDFIPKQSRDISVRPGASLGTEMDVLDIYELLKKTGKLTKKQLKEIIKKEYYK